MIVAFTVQRGTRLFAGQDNPRIVVYTICDARGHVEEGWQPSILKTKRQAGSSTG